VYLPEFVIVEVHFVEENTGRDMIGLGSDQEPINKARGGTWKSKGGNDAKKVDIGGDDMRLLAELGGTSDDIVLTVGHIVDNPRTVVLHFEEDVVTYSHRIRLLVTTQTIIATQPAVEKGYG
jgi:hypothetical protein